MSTYFNDKVALVTGAGRGIGAATAILLASKGAKVIVTSRSQNELDATVNEIKTNGGEGAAMVTDLADTEQIDKLFGWVDQEYGRLDILINNAAAFLHRPLVETTLTEWNQLMRVNVTSLFLTCQHAFKRMQASGGSIVNVSSLAGIQHAEKFAGFSAYCASKAAVVGLTEALGVEGKQWGIRVNGVAPGAVDTAMLKKSFPDFKAKTTPADIASIIVQIADSNNSGVLTGSVLPIFCNDQR